MAVNKFWRHRNVLVTGCTGLLGSCLTRALLDRQATVIGLERDWVPQSDLMRSGLDRRMRLVHGCVEDYPLLERTLNEYEIETVFHLAAQTIVGTANRAPLSTFETNIRGTWNLLEACRRVSTVKRVVVASSDKAYGEQKKLPYSEETPLQGVHPYDVSKSCADLISIAYYKSYGLPVCVTRCGNFFGGGDLNFNRIVPGTIRSALFNESPIIRSDGTYVRDYFYIEDGAMAYILLAEKMADTKLHGQSFNFSNEEPLSVLKMAQKILQIMGKSRLKLKILNQAQNEIPRQTLSSEKARRLLGWKPQFTIEEGLRRTARWYKDYFDD
ncbi:MAG: GDP-mannose 4,6-dehydratase [Elusimicrobia bacterium]|nr:GDP-mannose 4,6-dehydratase [Elusimicrobiota bacterium]